MPVTEDAARLYETWVGMGGEGIVLKERGSIYRPGVRSPSWLKLKPKLTLGAVVTGRLGDADPVGIRQAVRIRRDEPFELRVGEHAELICWGVMPSGMLRHPLLLRWLD